MQLCVELLFKLLFVLDTVLLSLHSSVIQVVGIYFLDRWFRSLGRIFLTFTLILRESSENILNLLRGTPASVNLRYRLVSLLLLLHLQLLKSSNLLLSHLLVIELVANKLFSGSFLLPVRIGDKRTLLLFCIFNFLFYFVDLLVFPVQKSLLSSDELVFLLVFPSSLLNFPLRNHKVCCVTINVLNIISKVSFFRWLNYALLIILLLNRTWISFRRSYRKWLLVLYLFKKLCL